MMLISGSPDLSREMSAKVYNARQGEWRRSVDGNQPIAGDVGRHWCLIRQMWTRVGYAVRNASATVLAACAIVTLGCEGQSARPPERTVPSASLGLTSTTPPSGSRPPGARTASSAPDCVRDPHVVLRKIRDRKPEVSDLRDIRIHGGVLIFEIRIDSSGTVADVRLAKPVDQQPPWPTLAERWRKAISAWRYEPPILDYKPVAVCLTVTVRVEVI